MTRIYVPFVPLAAVLIINGAAAQRTWIVDQYNGPGTNFTDLPPAVAAAGAGDQILIRSGSYTAPVITKGLTLIPEKWSMSLAFVGTLTVRDLPANERCLVKSMTAQPLTTVDILCQDNDGPVHFEYTSLGSGNDNLWSIIRCKQVTMTLCFVSDVLIDQSNVVLSSCSLHARRSTQTLGPKPWAMSATNSKVTLASTTVSGSAGSFDPFNCTVISQPGPGLSLQNSDVLATFSSFVLGGSLGSAFCGQLAATPSVFGTGTFTYDPTVPTPVFYGPVQGNVQLIQRSVPDLLATFNWPGGALDLRVWGPANAPAAFLGSLALPGVPSFACPAFCTGAQGWPGLWIDPCAFFIAGIGSTGPNRAYSLRIPIPNPNTFPIVPLAFQAVVLNQSGGIDLSTGGVTITGPQGTVQP